MELPCFKQAHNSRCWKPLSSTISGDQDNSLHKGSDLHLRHLLFDLLLSILKKWHLSFNVLLTLVTFLHWDVEGTEAFCSKHKSIAGPYWRAVTTLCMISIIVKRLAPFSHTTNLQWDMVFHWSQLIYLLNGRHGRIFSYIHTEYWTKCHFYQALHSHCRHSSCCLHKKNSHLHYDWTSILSLC